MPSENQGPSIAGSARPLGIGAVILRLGAIGAVALAAAASFAYVGGWLSPARLTQASIMDAFAQVNGPHPGFRRNHAKGVCVSGWFDSTGAATLLSRSEILEAGRVPVIGRFALAGGMPMQIDTPSAVRSLALRFLEPDGQEWRTGMNDIPVFPVNTAQGFYDQLLATKLDPATGRPDPNAMRAFLARHPETVRAMALIKTRSVAAGFADSTFNSLDAFRLVDAGGRSTPVRWAAVPLDPPAADAAAPPANSDKNYLFDDLIARIHRRPLEWRLMITVGQAQDPTADATLPWPPDRAQIDAGTVTLDTVSSEEGGPCTDINFDPLVLPSGIEPSDDPLLSARSAAYARSFTLRAAERRDQAPSAITPQEVHARGKT
jgi:catalase